MFSEKVAVDCTTRKRELPSKNIVKCPKCGEIGLKGEFGSKKGIIEGYMYIHKVYTTNRQEGCTVKIANE